jgi:hypothetical protein
MDITNKYIPIDWKKYFLINNTIVKKYIKTYGLSFLNQTFLKIRTAHKSKLPYTILIKFKDNDDIVAVIYQSEYEYALKTLLEYCIDIEYYELCTEIHSYLESTKKRKRKYVRKSKVTSNV